jgi:hypothetical protein
LADAGSDSSWTLARVLETTRGGPGEFSEFRGMVEQRLRQRALTELVIEGLRSQTYVDIRLDEGDL